MRVVAAVVAALLPWAGSPAAAQTAEPCPSGPVALTFDDGPHATYTPQVLDVLAGRQARATFFVVGQLVAARPAVLARTARDGHIVANHTWAHERLPGLNDLQIASTLNRTSDVIQQVTGHRPPLMRPPYGSIDGRVARVAASVGLLPVLWDTDTSDYAGVGPDEIARRVLGNLRPGAVFLLHDGVGRSGDTVAALPRIIDEARARGFCFGVLDPAGRVLHDPRRAARFVTHRIAGPDRIGTAAALSRTGWAPGTRAAVLVPATSWPDALTAAGLAGAAGAPLLLTDPHSLSAVTADELRRLGVQMAYVVGGLDETISGQLAAMGIAAFPARGRDRYETAELVAWESIAEGGSADRVLVASGETFADALGASALAAGLRMPLLLADPADPDRLARQAGALGAQETWVVGGPAAVSDSHLAGLPSPQRLAGADRIATSTVVATRAREHGLTGSAVLASATNFPDGLAGGSFAGQRQRGPVLLTTPDSLHPLAEQWLVAHAGAEPSVVIAGGPAAISGGAECQLRTGFRYVFDCSQPR